jgi:hypothetical protein
MPKFFIGVASPVFPGIPFEYKEQKYNQELTAELDFPSFHMYGKNDDWAKYLKTHLLFKEESRSEFIEYDSGHKFP